MSEPLLSELREQPPGERKKQLRDLARREGSAALDTLRQALSIPSLREAALQALGDVPDQEAWDLLQEVAEGEKNRKVRKAARRAQHRLRSRGFQPSVSRKRPPSPPRRTELAQATWFDPDGAQFTRIVQQAPLGMLRYAGFILSPAGLEQGLYVTTNRHDVEEILAEEDERFGDRLVDVGLAYATHLIEKAADRSRVQDHRLPEAYFEASQILNQAPEDSLPEALQEIEAGAAPPSPREVEIMFAHQSMQSWLLPLQELVPYAEEWMERMEQQPEMEQGTINLGAIQARAQMTTQIVSDLIDEDLQQRLTRQLREQARLFYSAGEQERARTALRCAVTLEEKASPDHPFFRSLVGQNMDMIFHVLEEEEEEEEWEDSWQRAGEGGLWTPRPPREREEQPPSSGLWLPGQE